MKFWWKLLTVILNDPNIGLFILVKHKKLYRDQMNPLNQDIHQIAQRLFICPNIEVVINMWLK